MSNLFIELLKLGNGILIGVELLHFIFILIIIYACVKIFWLVVGKNND